MATLSKTKLGLLEVRTEALQRYAGAAALRRAVPGAPALGAGRLPASSHRPSRREIRRGSSIQLILRSPDNREGQRPATGRLHLRPSASGRASRASMPNCTMATQASASCSICRARTLAFDLIMDAQIPSRIGNAWQQLLKVPHTHNIVAGDDVEDLVTLDKPGDLGPQLCCWLLAECDGRIVEPAERALVDLTPPAAPGALDHEIRGRVLGDRRCREHSVPAVVVHLRQRRRGHRRLELRVGDGLAIAPPADPVDALRRAGPPGSR